jgi:hypothetical protein
VVTAVQVQAAQAALLLRRPYREVLFRILVVAAEQASMLLALAEPMQEQERLPA